MKIYALLYKYQTQKGEKTNVVSQLVHDVSESLEDVMAETERKIMKEEGYVNSSLNLELRSVMPLNSLLDKIQIKLPELVKSAKERARLTKVAEALNESDS